MLWSRGSQDIGASSQVQHEVSFDPLHSCRMPRTKATTNVIGSYLMSCRALCTVSCSGHATWVKMRVRTESRPEAELETRRQLLSAIIIEHCIPNATSSRSGPSRRRSQPRHAGHEAAANRARAEVEETAACVAYSAARRRTAISSKYDIDHAGRQ